MRYAVVVLVLAVLVYMVIDFNGRTAELNRLKAENQIVHAQLASRQQTRDTLETQIAYATSDAAAIQWAYENHMVRPGDNAVVPVQPVQITPVPTPRPVPTATVISNLSRWLSLFVDPEVLGP
jgi:hypothetical protein